MYTISDSGNVFRQQLEECVTHAPSVREALSGKIQQVFVQRYKSETEAVDALKDLQANITQELRANDQSGQAEIVEDTIARLADKAFPGIKFVAKRPRGEEGELPQEKRARVEKLPGEEQSSVTPMEEESPLKRATSAKRKPPKTTSSLEPSATLQKTLVTKFIKHLPRDVQKKLEEAAKNKDVRNYIFLVRELIDMLPPESIAQILTELPRTDQKAILAMMPSKEEKVQESRALRFLNAISQDKEYMALYYSTLGKPCHTIKDLKRLEGNPRACQRIISFADFLHIELKREWYNLPTEIRALYPEITSFDNIEMGKKILQAVRAYNLVLLGDKLSPPIPHQVFKSQEELSSAGEKNAHLLPTLNCESVELRNVKEMTHLPTEIKDLKNLKYLEIIGASYSTLPDQIGEIKSLKTLELHANNLPRLPPTIGQLKELTLLNVSNNQLTSLPPTIGQLKKLHTLHLEDNHLTSLPQEFSELTALTILRLHGNPLNTSAKILPLPPHIALLEVEDDKILSLPSELYGALINSTYFSVLLRVIGTAIQRIKLPEIELPEI